MPKKGETKQPKEPKEVKQDNEPKRADYQLRNYSEVNDEIAKIQKQIKKLELLVSINEHDTELEKKRSDQKEFNQQLKEMEAIKQLLMDIEINFPEIIVIIKWIMNQIYMWKDRYERASKR
jgi:hypothetical protein